MKAYRRSENIDPKIFLLLAKTEVIVAFLPLCPWKNPRYLISRRLGGLQRWPERFGVRDIFSCPDSKP